VSGLRAVAVVVPAHDEQALLPGCLAALATARDRLAASAPHVAVSVTVVLDACTDGSAAVVAAHPGVQVVEVALRCVGAARAAGTAHAVAAAGGRADRMWTAHSDADSQVPEGWLQAMVDAADAGADALLGTVVPDDALTPAGHRRWRALHPMAEGHPYVHGANLGVRASTLAAVGGWRPLPTGEDVDLAARLQAHPATVVRSTALVPVLTSARRDARAPAGFSGYLQEMTVA
jgi:hypothetical protein